MPHSIDIGDLVQDGVIGLMDAAQRFDAGRGIKSRRLPNGARGDDSTRCARPAGSGEQAGLPPAQAAREELRRTLGYEPSVADLAAKVGSDEKRLNRTIVRINTIESTSPALCEFRERRREQPARRVCALSEPESPHRAYERTETEDRVRAAIASLPRASARSSASTTTAT